MEFKKCSRCGSFYLSGNTVCENCAPKDTFELSKLRTYFDTENYSSSIDHIAVDTGISVKNLNRYFENEEFSNILNIKL